MAELLAPNGKPSNLTPEQYKLVRLPAFKEWFGDWENLILTKINDSGIDEISLKRLEDGVSKVVDENGEPLPVYHGTYLNNGLFNEFNNVSYFTDNIITAQKYPIDSYVFYETFDEFVDDYGLDESDIKRLKKYGYDIDKLKIGNIMVREDDWSAIWKDYDPSKLFVYKCFLNLRNPQIIENAEDIDITSLSEQDTRIKDAKIENYDSIVGIYPYKWFSQDKIYYHQRIMGNYENEKHFITFRSNEIKLADGTNTTFDSNNPDIRFDGGGRVSNYKEFYDNLQIEDGSKYIGQKFADVFPYIGKKTSPAQFRISVKEYNNLLGRLENDNYTTKGIKTADLNRLEKRQKYIDKKKYLSRFYLDPSGTIIRFDNSDNTYSDGGSIIINPTEIVCHNCHWKWKVKDGGDDLFICHKCYTDNTKFYKFEGLEGEKILDTISYKKGGRTIAQTPAPKKDQIKGSDKNKEGSSKDLKSAKKIELSDSTIEAIKNKVDKHNEKHPKKKITIDSAKAVVRRGMGAYSSSHRPTIKGGNPNSRVAWGLARLNAFLYKIVNGKSKSGKYSQDNDLIEELGYKVEKYENGGDIQAYEQAMGISEFDEGGEAKPKKVYVSIRLDNELEKIPNTFSEYFTNYSEKPFEELKNGKLLGLVGVSTSPNNIAEWFIHRDCLIVMDYDEFISLNETETINYYDPYQLMKNNLYLFKRLYANITRNGEQEGSYVFKQTLVKILEKTIREINLEMNLAEGQKYSELYRISRFLSPYETRAFPDWIEKNEIKIESPVDLTNAILDFNKLNDNYLGNGFPNSVLTFDELLPVVEKGITNASSVYDSEQEIVLNNRELNIPKNSQLFFIGKDEVGRQRESNKNELIEKYNLKELYKVYFVDAQQIQKYRNFWVKKEEEKFNNKIETGKQNLEIKKSQVTNNLIDYFIQHSIDVVIDKVNKEILSYESGSLEFYDSTKDDYEEINWVHIPLVDELFSKYTEIVKKSWKETIESKGVSQVNLYSFNVFTDNAYREFKTYIEQNRDKYEELENYRNTKGRPTFNLGLLEYDLYKSLYDYENLPEWIDYKKLSKMYLNNMGTEIYRYYDKKDLPLISYYNQGGETEKINNDITYELIDDEFGFLVLIKHNEEKIGEIAFEKDRDNSFTITDAVIDAKFKGNRIYPNAIIEILKRKSNITINSVFRSSDAEKSWKYLIQNLPKNIQHREQHLKDENTTLYQISLNKNSKYDEGGNTDEPTHFWGTEAGGVLVYCSTTERYLILLRSDWVLEPNTWGIISGKLDDEENVQEAVLREAEEETRHKLGTLIPSFIFEKPNFKFHNFVSIVEEEFTPELNWENSDYKWVKLNEMPENLHFGLKLLIDKEDLPKLVEKNNNMNKNQNPKDTITMDIPLLIRFAELMREEIKTDVALHEIVENLLEIKDKGILTMGDYDSIVGNVTGTEESANEQVNKPEEEKMEEGGKVNSIKSKKGDIKISLDENWYSDDTDVELVPVSELIKFREFDRKVKPKYNQDNSRDNINHLKYMFQKEGVKSPLIIEYSPENNSVLVIEGNHRINSAIDLGMEFLPARVVLKKYGNYTENQLKNTMQVSGVKADESGYIPSNLKPSKIGIAGAMPIAYAEGGIIEGRLHSECGDDGCGRKFQVGENGHIIEAERDEAVIVAEAFNDEEEYTIKGTPSEVASALNVMGGGKNFDKGATIIKNGQELEIPELKNQATDTDVDDIIDPSSIIINRRSMADEKKYEVKGTPKQIASAINSINGNGVVIEKGAEIKEN